MCVSIYKRQKMNDQISMKCWKQFNTHEIAINVTWYTSKRLNNQHDNHSEWERRLKCTCWLAIPWQAAHTTEKYEHRCAQQFGQKHCNFIRCFATHFGLTKIDLCFLFFSSNVDNHCKWHKTYTLIDIWLITKHAIYLLTFMRFEML